MIYLDNAATSNPKPQSVYDEVLKTMMNINANPGRGGHSLSLMAGNLVYEARDKIANFFGAKDPSRVIFTKNATEALNIAIFGILKKGDHVIVSNMEHNSVMRPLKHLEKDIGIKISVIPSEASGEIKLESLEKSINIKTKLIVCTFSSNVNGIVMPIKEIERITKNYGIILLVDAAQGAGAIEINMEDMGIDMLVFAGHKSLFGPQGTGGLILKNDIKIKPFMLGGTGSHSESVYQPEFLPDFLESGTLNTPGIAGLSAGIDFINSIGIERIKQHKQSLVNYLTDAIVDIGKFRIYNSTVKDKNTGIVAINLRDVDSTELSYVLDKAYGIATRAGLHCAPMAHNHFKTINSGILRFSFGYFNTKEHADTTIKALQEISNNT